MNGHLTWYVARAAGIVTWGLLVASMIWGLLYATRVFRRRVPLWWLLGVHRFLSGLAVIFTAVHVVALLLDQYIGFSWSDALVPFASSWHPIAVGWGILAMYLLVAIETTSLLKARLPYGVWRAIHLGSYPLFALATIHGLSSGTDVKVVVTNGLEIALGAIAVAAAIVALDQRIGASPRRPVPAPRQPAQFG